MDIKPYGGNMRHSLHIMHFLELCGVWLNNAIFGQVTSNNNVSCTGVGMKKYFKYGLVASLLISGLLGIGALLTGNFNEIQIRTLFTTLAFTVYSIIGLCCNSLVDNRYSVFGKLGLGVTLVGLLYAVVTTWATPESVEFLQFRFSLLVIAICFAHCSLMLSVKTYGPAISFVKVISISASVTVAVIVLAMISNLDTSSGTFKLLGMVSIVGVITTIMAPILSVTANKSNQSERF